MIFIAEVKTHSPYWPDDTHPDPRPRHELLKQAMVKGDWISIHVDSEWWGSYGQLLSARTALKCNKMKKPLLAKGFHTTTRALDITFDYGKADYALCVGWVPPKRYWDRVLVEAESLDELADLPHEVKAVWNARDPRTGEDRGIDPYVARAVREKGWLCQASGIRARADVDPSMDAFIVGEHLKEFV